jgi:hypothetical protein
MPQCCLATRVPRAGCCQHAGLVASSPTGCQVLCSTHRLTRVLHTPSTPQNTAANNGGAIFFPPLGGANLPDTTAVLTIRDSVFTQNVAYGAGGALWMQSRVKVPKALSVSGTAFHNNKVRCRCCGGAAGLRCAALRCAAPGPGPRLLAGGWLAGTEGAACRLVPPCPGPQKGLAAAGVVREH